MTTSTRELEFSIRTPTGEVLRRFARVHDRELHLILVSHDLGRYAHLHPNRDANGKWSVALPALEPGEYWLYTDFTVSDGPALTLRQDLSIAGVAPERAAPASTSSADIDGFHVEIDGMLRVASATDLTFRVSRDGEPTELEPYLGANGHLVVIRAGDGAFLHVHPLEESSGPNEVAFSVHPPSAGRYALFLDFQTGGLVHTAAFGADVDEASGTAKHH